MIDTHTHLQDERYAEDLDQVLERAAQAGITAAIVPGIHLQDCQAVLELVERHANGPCRLYAAVGIHPTWAHDLPSTWLSDLEALASNPQVVAIGEIGLDYYWPAVQDRGWVCAEPEVQREVFREELALAAALDLPVIVHDRDAHEDVLASLEGWLAEDPNRAGTLHAYAGGPDLLPKALEMGLYIGMDGPVTFNNAVDLQAVARHVPLDRLLLETDSPYLTPVPHRGQRNEPAYVRYVAERIATLRGVGRDIVDQATTHNAQRLFRLT